MMRRVELMRQSWRTTAHGIALILVGLGTMAAVVGGVIASAIEGDSIDTAAVSGKLTIAVTSLATGSGLLFAKDDDDGS